MLLIRHLLLGIVVIGLAVGCDQATSAATEQEQAIANRKAEVNSLLLQARQEQRAARLDEAADLVDRVLFLEPDNAAAQILQSILEDQHFLAEFKLKAKRSHELPPRWTRGELDTWSSLETHEQRVQWLRGR